MRRIPGTRAAQRANAQRGDADAVLDRLGARRFRSLDAAFNRITRDAALLLDAARISIWLFSGDRQRVNCVHAFPAARVCGPTLAVARYPQFVRTLEKTGTFILVDAAECPADCDPALVDCLEQFNVVSMLGVALVIEDDMVGLLCHESREPRHWTTLECEHARQLARVACDAIVDARARQLPGFAARLRSLVDNSVDAVGMASARGAFEYLNAAARDILGLASDEPVAGLRMADFMPSHERRQVFRTILAAARDQQSWTGRLTMVTRQNEPFEATITIRFHRDAHDEVGYITLSIRELAQRQEVERQVNEVRARYENAFVYAGDSVIIVDPASGRVLDADRGFHKLLGYARKQPPTLTLQALMPERAAQISTYVERTLRDGHFLCGEQQLAHARGRRVHAEMSLLRTEWQGQTVVSVRLRDISELVAHRRDIERLAYYDPLTGLANSNLLRERAEAMLADSLAGHRTVYFVLLQIDRWERVFDLQGYQVAESLIRQIGARLTRVFKPHDVLLARVLGGVEMGLLFNGDERRLEQLVDLAHDAFEDGFRADGDLLHLGVRSGSARAPLDAVNFKDLSKRAGLALRNAHLRELQHCAYDPTQSRRIQDEHLLEEDLRRAIGSDQFSLRYQPVRCLVPEQGWSALEVLVRWHHPTLGEVAPSDFIPLAEDSQLVVAIDRRSLNDACVAAANWPARLSSVRISINISVVTLMHPGVVDIVRDALANAGLKASRLCLEITETSVMRDRIQAAAVLRQLHALGVFIALDDFGTGYSSLAYLKDLPVDVLKIDRDFIRGIGTDSRDERAIQTIVELGHDLGILVVAEGVESRAQYMWLVSRKVDFVQGFHIGVPMTLAELDGEWSSNTR
jgi:PAS domain S-box-containing protein/diguanylate cyclase (GGDEF)-like protein